MDGDKCFKAGLWGSIIAAICCFTPVLVLGLGVIGLATLTPYLDYVLFPMPSSRSMAHAMTQLPCQFF